MAMTDVGLFDEPLEESGEKSCEEKYRTAYEEGMREGLGLPWVFPGGQYAQGDLNRTLAVHRGPQKRPTENLRWIAAGARAFGRWLRARPDEARFWSMGHPRHFGRWLTQYKLERETAKAPTRTREMLIQHEPEPISAVHMITSLGAMRLQ